MAALWAATRAQFWAIPKGEAPVALKEIHMVDKMAKSSEN